MADCDDDALDHRDPVRSSGGLRIADGDEMSRYSAMNWDRDAEKEMPPGWHVGGEIFSWPRRPGREQRAEDPYSVVYARGPRGELVEGIGYTWWLAVANLVRQVNEVAAK